MWQCRSPVVIYTALCLATLFKSIILEKPSNCNIYREFCYNTTIMYICARPLRPEESVIYKFVLSNAKSVYPFCSIPPWCIIRSRTNLCGGERICIQNLTRNKVELTGFRAWERLHFMSLRIRHQSRRGDL
jgi:hypothetical protein